MSLRAVVMRAAALVLWATSAHAASPVDGMLAEASTPEQLRATLLDFARSAPDTAVADKGAALLYAGMSYEYAARPDSALLCYERAVAVRGGREERDAFVDVLLDRGQPDDPRRALEVLGPRLKQAMTASEREIALTRGRQGWAYYIMGRGDSAVSILRSQRRWLLDPVTPRQRDWRYRLGLVELEHGDPAKSIEAMMPLALESRFQDRDVMGILRDAAQKSPHSDQFGSLMKQELARIDGLEQQALAAFHGRRLTFTGHDGVTIGAVVVTSARRPARAAVVVMDPDEIADSYDSLATGLAAAGYSVILVEPRGAGWSVSPSCPLPSTWHGREDQIRGLVARDVLPALRALAAAAPTDTSRYLVVGGLGSCAIAAEAASLDRRVRAVVMLSPNPASVEIGPMRAWLKASRAPVFFEVPVMDRASVPIAEALYEGLDPRASRIAESDIVGSGARIFRYDKSALPRLLTWADDSWRTTRTKEKAGGSKP